LSIEQFCGERAFDRKRFFDAETRSAVTSLRWSACPFKALPLGLACLLIIACYYRMAAMQRDLRGSSENREVAESRQIDAGRNTGRSIIFRIANAFS
jgi:hypothetical protein